MKNKNVYIIAGPNGSGKTTFAKTFLPEYAKCNRFINAEPKPKIIAKKQNAHIDIVDDDLFEDIINKLGVKL